MSAGAKIFSPEWSRRAALFWASACGLGYLPRAPGTFGTLAGLPLWLVLSRLPTWGWVGATVAIALAAVFVASAAERVYGRHDVQHIVIDEVAGFCFTVLLVPFSWHQALLAFAVFRALDMFKPWPIGWLDEHVRGGFGVVLDDVVAGLLGCGALHGLRLLLGYWW